MEEILSDLIESIRDRDDLAVWLTLDNGDSRAVSNTGDVWESGVVSTMHDPEDLDAPQPTFIAISHVVAATIGKAKRYV